MAEIKIKKGDEIFCVHRIALRGGSDVGMPIKGKILAITSKLNRQIAVELDEEVANCHDCDGLGEEGHCLWCRPWHILTPSEWEEKSKAMKAAAENTKKLNTELDELVLRNVD